MSVLFAERFDEPLGSPSSPGSSRKGAAGESVVGRAPTWVERVDWGVIGVASGLLLLWMLNALLEAVLS